MGRERRGSNGLGFVALVTYRAVRNKPEWRSLLYWRSAPFGGVRRCEHVQTGEHEQDGGNNARRPIQSQMDLAGGTAATRLAGGRVVTVAVTAMEFQHPVYVGDEVSCYTSITKAGHTSITVKVKSFARRGRTGDTMQVTEGLFIYVAVDPNLNPRTVYD